MNGITFNYSPCLGTAIWDYITENKAASTNFKVCSIAKNKIDPLNLYCSHNFFSKTLTKEENENFKIYLTNFLNTLNVTKLDIFIKTDSPSTQSIFVNYEIEKVEQGQINSLTSLIASITKEAIEQISIIHNCSNTFSFLNSIQQDIASVSVSNLPACTGSLVEYSSVDPIYKNDSFQCDYYINYNNSLGIQLVLDKDADIKATQNKCKRTKPGSQPQYCALP